MVRRFLCVRIDKIRIKMHDHIVRTLVDVKYVQELKKNVISLYILDFIKCTFKIGDGVMKISNSALIVMKGKKNQRSL